MRHAASSALISLPQAMGKVNAKLPILGELEIANLNKRSMKTGKNAAEREAWLHVECGKVQLPGGCA